LSLRFGELHVKASVIDLRAFRRETSARRRDHFIAGRLCQPARLVAARSEEARQAVLGGLVSAHAQTWSWLRPWLPADFDADAYGLRALEVSMRWEIRPEPAGRAAALWAAQRELQLPVFAELLESLGAAGKLRPLEPASAAERTDTRDVQARERLGRRWSLVHTPGAAEELSLRLYFMLSMARATLRWAKHVVSFEGWLDYIVRKASRHTGEPIELSERERQWPLVFLWGRVFRHLRDKNRKGAPR
jgi:hypothetical protein